MHEIGAIDWHGYSSLNREASVSVASASSRGNEHLYTLISRDERAPSEYNQNFVLRVACLKEHCAEVTGKIGGTNEQIQRIQRIDALFEQCLLCLLSEACVCQMIKQFSVEVMLSFIEMSQFKALMESDTELLADIRKNNSDFSFEQTYKGIPKLPSDFTLKSFIVFQKFELSCFAFVKTCFCLKEHTPNKESLKESEALALEQRKKVYFQIANDLFLKYETVFQRSLISNDTVSNVSESEAEFEINVSYADRRRVQQILQLRLNEKIASEKGTETKIGRAIIRLSQTNDSEMLYTLFDACLREMVYYARNTVSNVNGFMNSEISVDIMQ